MLHHIGQTGQAHAGEQDEQAQVPLAEEPVQGGRPGKDVADFGQLRGLHRDAGNGQPVGRSIFGAGEAQQVEHHGEAQQADGPGGHEPADFLGPVQVAQEDPQHQEQGQSQHHAEELLEQGGGIGGGGHRQGEGGQEEGDGLHLKAYPAQGAEGEEVQPHHPRQQQEGERDHHRGVLPLADGELECGEGLEHGEEHQPQPGGHGPHGPPPLAALSLFLRREGEQHGLHPADAHHVAVLDGGGALHRPAVYRHATLGAQVVGRPGVVRLANQGGVLPGYHRIVENHVGVAAPAENVLPVGQRLLSPVGQGQVGPHLRQTGHGEQGADRPYENEQGQHREQKAHRRGEPGPDLGIGGHPVQQLLHPPTSFSLEYTAV